MGRRIEIEIDGALYTGATPSAKDQLEMLQIATKNSVLPALGDNASDMGLAVALASMDALSLNRLKDLCIKNGKIVRDADSIPVAENLFQDAIQNYLLLLGKVLQENIGPFWKLSAGSENGASAAAATSETEAE
ncbi:phage tail assembly chaperone [Pectobacterium brasiliense]|uniref:Uncharacterized protein n=2 Tax=Pectobacterium TaxID=122277 RepID=A0A433NJE1_9GAMM|nr:MULTISPECIES: hypothetical protein [Pectobacterium]GKW27768.1 hypothetical protein PEC331060_09460 [Pectobacterium carotovorum subsp. carotovorum]MBN3046508.1 hypothetical protein [Pectobacterium brasiliense]MBN3056761.1 hypothetical protein [Pectobacterium brasiliense]MBN3075359.1 hypothetical protein [Pectobacterium brasiliense]MBN3083515.1 hypothetical protein [Pectobacterium brasiliense]